MTATLLELRDVAVSFVMPTGLAAALRGVDLSVPKGMSMALVGESGCGKTITGKSILRLLPGNARLTGEIRFEGADLLKLPQPEMQHVRGRRISMIFQDPATALNPVFTIGQQLSAVLRYHRVVPPKLLRQRALELLDEVGLPEPGRVLHQYPYELSGGMQQRAMIAIALSANPSLLIADEPTTSLDVTIQAQILELLRELQSARGLTILLITHNMAVVRQNCQRVAVLYAGRVVEVGEVDEVLGAPQHPYTEALLASLPTRASRRQTLKVIPGLLPSANEAIEGCAFAPRCPYAMAICRDVPPELVTSGSHAVACWLRSDSRSTVA